MAFGDFIKSDDDTSGSFKTTYTGDLGSNPASGNILLFGACVRLGSIGVTTPPSGFTFLTGDNSGNDSWNLYYKISDGTEQTASIVWDTSRNGQAWYLEYEWDGSTPTVVSNENIDNVASPTNSQPSGAATPDTATNLAIALHGSGSANNSFNAQAVDGSWIEDIVFTNGGTPQVKFSRLVNAAVSSQEATHTDTDTGDDMYGAITIFSVPAAAAFHVFELPKIVHPDFQYPSRKPIGQVEIDWSNPITMGLQQYLLFTEGGGGIKDLVSGLFRGIDTGTWGSSKAGRHLDFADTRIQITDTSASAYTRLLLVSYDASPNQDNLMTNSASGAYLWSSSGGSTRLGHNSSFNMLTGNQVPLNKPIAVGATYESAFSRAKLFEDGKVVASTLSAPTISSGRTDLGSYNAGFYFNGKMYMALTYTRELSEGEMNELSLNPYSILRPAVPLQYFTPAEEAAIIGRIMGSIAGHGGLVGHGGLAGKRGGLAG